MKQPSHSQPASGPVSVPAHVVHLPEGGPFVGFVHAAHVNGGEGGRGGPRGDITSRSMSFLAGDDCTNDLIEVSFACAGAEAPAARACEGDANDAILCIDGEDRGDLLGDIEGVAMGRLEYGDTRVAISPYAYMNSLPHGPEWPRGVTQCRQVVVNEPPDVRSNKPSQ